MRPTLEACRSPHPHCLVVIVTPVAQPEDIALVAVDLRAATA